MLYKHLNECVCAVRLLFRDFKKSEIMFYTFKMRAVALVGAWNHPSRRRLRCCCCCCCCRSPYRHHHHYEKECPIACFIPLSCHFNGNATVLMVCIIYVRCSQSKMNLLWFFRVPLLLPCYIAEVIPPPCSDDGFQTVMKLSSSKRRRKKLHILIIWHSIKYLLNTAQRGASSAISWENMPQIAHLLVRDETKKYYKHLT